MNYTSPFSLSLPLFSLYVQCVWGKEGSVFADDRVWGQQVFIIVVVVVSGRATFSCRLQTTNVCVYMCACVHAWICRVFNHGSNSVTHAVASSPDQYHIGLIAPCSYYNLPQPTPDKFPLLWIVTVTIYIFCGLCVCDADLSLLVDLPSSIKIDWMCIRMRVTSRHRCRLRRQHQQLIITGTTSMWQPILTSNRTSNIVIMPSNV